MVNPIDLSVRVAEIILPLSLSEYFAEFGFVVEDFISGSFAKSKSCA